MYITVIPNRNSPPAILLRESFREEGVVKNRTLANLSDWAPERVEALRVLLKGGDLVTLSDGSVWLVTLVPEPWNLTAGWTRALITLQNGT